MTAKEFYEPLYALLQDVTPLKKDCGVLCDGICCKDSDEPAGMLLFPGEEQLLKDVSFAEVIDSNCEYGETGVAKLMLCKGQCDRALRPLACRIFPLLPYRHKGEKLQIIMDPRAKGMCPLARSLQPEQLEPLFSECVRQIAYRILQLKDGAEYLDMLADIADDADFLK
ncbi:MAG: hypothetical protein IJE10_05590 [Clostridia bacterium]|nr:hypothetical protein [Clostridia bacterium]